MHARKIEIVRDLRKKLAGKKTKLKKEDGREMIARMRKKWWEI